jgi:hypothetical protein
MSLINDALNRARAEAARRQAAERGEIPAPEPPPETTVHRRIPAWFWALGALLLVTGVLLLRRVPPDPGTEPDSRAPTGPMAVAPTESPAAEPTLEPTAQPAEAPPPPAPNARTSPDPAATSRVATPDASPPAAQAAPGAAAVVAEAPPSPPVATPPARSITPTQAARPQTSDSVPPAGRSPAPAADSAPPQAATAPSPSDSVDAGRADAAPGPATDSGGDTLATDGQAATVWPGDPSGEEVWYYVGKIALPGGGEIELDGIAWSASSPSALLNGSLLQVGSEILGLRVAEIQQRTVILTGHGRRVALQLGPGQ